MHHRGKYDLCFGSAEALQTADEFIQVVGAFKNGLNEDGIFSRNVTRFDNVGAIRF